jgi:hypothetical protein
MFITNTIIHFSFGSVKHLRETKNSLFGSAKLSAQVGYISIGTSAHIPIDGFVEAEEAHKR